MSRLLICLGFSLAVAIAPAGCRDRGGQRPLPVIAPAPAAGDAGRCTDLADLRVCWNDPSPGPKGAPVPAGCVADARGGSVCVAPRPLPDRVPPAAGWRCTGQGRERSCRDRRLLAGPFECRKRTCTQEYPRMPDDGEWECIDLDGVTLCRRGVPAAGVIAGPSDPGWVCGERTGGDPGERLCVDYSPDLPGGDTRGWRCRYDHKRGEHRVCTRRDDAPALGRACRGDRGCPATLDCVAGHCVPAAPAPSCWFDKDCEPGSKCRLGTCAEGT